MQNPCSVSSLARYLNPPTVTEGPKHRESPYPGLTRDLRHMNLLITSRTKFQMGLHLSAHFDCRKEMSRKSRILIVGGGGVGTIAGLNLEVGGLATVTFVLRSSYPAVKSQGFKIDSCDHGSLTGWHPSGGILPGVPNVLQGETEPFDFVLCCTKDSS